MRGAFDCLERREEVKGVRRSTDLPGFAIDAVRHTVADANTVTTDREPLVGFVNAHDPRFRELRRFVDPSHLMPEDLLSGAQSVVSLFIPFNPGVVAANAQDRRMVAYEWSPPMRDVLDASGAW
jgi:epoxyqueuosine reductase QueG